MLSISDNSTIDSRVRGTTVGTVETATSTVSGNLTLDNIYNINNEERGSSGNKIFYLFFFS